MAKVGTRTGVTLRQERFFLPWVALSIWCLWLMWVVPGGEVIPFHALWISFAFLYGFESWPLRRTAVTLGLLALVSGSILLVRARTGAIPWEETAEIPLMLLLAVLVVWHVRRRQLALDTVRELAAREIARADRREYVARLTSHEMRTPLTIASGYVDLLLSEEHDAERREDLAVVRDELGRLSRAADRVLRMIQLGDRLERTPVDLDDLLAETAQRWATVAHRVWQVESAVGRVETSPERLRACLDTLIENAVRYTNDHDRVRLTCCRHGDALWLGVADSGPGLQPDVAAALNTGAVRVRSDADDPRDRTGLGMGIVREVVEGRGGHLAAGRSREGGALVGVVVPLVPGHDGLPALGTSRDDAPPTVVPEERQPV